MQSAWSHKWCQFSLDGVVVVTPINRPGHLFYMDTLRKGEDRFIPFFFFFF